MVCSPKLDGIRCLVTEAGPVTRALIPIPNAYIARALTDGRFVGLDGELLTLNPDGSFRSLSEITSDVMSREGEPEWRYFVFDMWARPELPHAMRRRNAELAVAGTELVLMRECICASADEAEVFYQECLSQGCEGIILRDGTAAYKGGRSTLREGGLIKHKPLLDDEGIVCGYREQRVNANPVERDALGYAKRSTAAAGLIPAGTLGSLEVRWRGVTFRLSSGLSDDDRALLWEMRERLDGLPVTFTYLGVGSHGRPRSPVFKSIRADIVSIPISSR